MFNKYHTMKFLDFLDISVRSILFCNEPDSPITQKTVSALL